MGKWSCSSCGEVKAFLTIVKALTLSEYQTQCERGLTTPPERPQEAILTVVGSSAHEMSTEDILSSLLSLLMVFKASVLVANVPCLSKRMKEHTHACQCKRWLWQKLTQLIFNCCGKTAQSTPSGSESNQLIRREWATAPWQILSWGPLYGLMSWNITTESPLVRRLPLTHLSCIRFQKNPSRRTHRIGIDRPCHEMWSAHTDTQRKLRSRGVDTLELELLPSWAGAKVAVGVGAFPPWGAFQLSLLLYNYRINKTSLWNSLDQCRHAGSSRLTYFTISVTAASKHDEKTSKKKCRLGTSSELGGL